MNPNKDKVVVVSGCFDLLHAGHIAFFRRAAEHGQVNVCLGTDENIIRLKGRPPLFSFSERKALLESIKYITAVHMETGKGLLAYEPEMRKLNPDFFVVNDDGARETKEALCKELGTKYIVLDRVPLEGLPARSSTSIKQDMKQSADKVVEPPYRICLAGGWLDQPFVNKVGSGPVVVVNIQPITTYNLRAGLATSSREKWKGELWNKRIFKQKPLELAKCLFGIENPPGSKYVSGSQDHIGLCVPGVSRLFYKDGDYWPQEVTTVKDKDICDWLEKTIVLIEIDQRPEGYDPLETQSITPEGVSLLAKGGQLCWDGIMEMDIEKFGKGLTATHDAWKIILPLTSNKDIDASLDKLTCQYGATGRVSTGCGGGYCILATQQDVPNGLRIKVRRTNE